MSRAPLIVNTILHQSVLIFCGVVLNACATLEPELQRLMDERDIQAQITLFSQAYIANDDEALMSLYANDAVIAPPQRHFITERSELQTYWTNPFARTVTEHKATPEQIVVDHNLAYDWGYYEGIGQRNGAPHPFGGKYLIVWERGDDGVWRIIQDMWN